MSRVREVRIIPLTRLSFAISLTKVNAAIHTMKRNFTAQNV